MSYLRGSANYVWCTTSVLGKGATGAVFQGVSKHDGEPVAVKTFNQLSHMRPQEVQVRGAGWGGKVIVMELCTGGSLFNILDDPENTYGLAEDEFLLVLEHLSAGMKHLRDNSLVHRDLKPGNIMKFVAEDGRIIYKLTDFGAARELEEDQEFVSLYGTEEYLHPDMYERAVLRKPVGKTFGASVDLWSIGVTLYHVATGNLPFRPYGGRKNKEMMYFITTKKESGVISGIQTTENGPVEWKRELPNTCQISAGLKTLITPLLAGLMEVDPRKRWSFEDFFSAVLNILARQKVHVFFVNRIQSLRVYMDLAVQKDLNDFQSLVTDQTDISPENQILLFKETSVAKILDNGRKSSAAIPKTTEDMPLILCHRENNNVSLEWDTKDLPKFPAFPNLVNVENDASLAKHTCGVGYCYKRRVEKISRSVSLINQAVKTINQVIATELVTVTKEGSQTQSVIQSLHQQLNLMNQFQKACHSFLSAVPSLEKSINVKIDSMGQLVEVQQIEFKSMSGHLAELEQPVKQLHSRFVENNVLMAEWDEATSEIKDISRASIKAATHVGKLRESWQHLLRDRATRNLTYNDEQFHILERIKMQEKAKCLSELLNDECQHAIIRLTEVLSDWYKTAQAAFIQTEILAKDTYQFEESLELYLLRMKEVVTTYQTDLSNMTSGLKPYTPQKRALRTRSRERGMNGGVDLSDRENSIGNSGSLETTYHPSTRKSSNRKTTTTTSQREYVKTFNKGLKELTSVQEEVWTILKENAELVNQFQTLTLSLLSSDGSQGYESNPSSTRNSLSKNDSDLSGKSNGSM
ncbi:Serine/threonine-protein kinase TBK1 [Orchesella cincta]|uniref:Serine/threonine-protein kinase TBK1 n=1 Tax=Orchesella cincta TaxID=48709 RepID=A0A1D2N254_ORCCI|nr:Serine/threonine-protein kinase TBK1 [Orchesella cincta]